MIQYDRVLMMLENGHNINVVYQDFSKAFNKVDLVLFVQISLESLKFQEHYGDGLLLLFLVEDKLSR